jgi:hypothetical protein
MDREEMLLEVWKKTVDVQMHFNDLELRLRNVAMTVLAALFAAAGFSMKESLHLDLLGRDVSLTGLVFVAAVIIWFAFYGMDRWWYHRLLKGAVDHGSKIEAALRAYVPEIDLGGEIGRASAVHVGTRKIRSDHKMDIFYGAIVVILILAATTAFVQPPKSAPVLPEKDAPAASQASAPILKPAAKHRHEPEQTKEVSQGMRQPASQRATKPGG